MSLAFCADCLSGVFAALTFLVLDKVAGQHVEFDALFLDAETFVAAAKHEIDDLFALLRLSSGICNNFAQSVVELGLILHEFGFGVASCFCLDAVLRNKFQEGSGFEVIDANAHIFRGRA